MTQRQVKKYRRKIFYINPRFQGGAALVFSVAIVAGGVVFGGLVYRDLGQTLWDASMQGHFQANTPYEIVQDALLRHLAGLFAGVTVLGIAVSLLLERATKAGVRACIVAFHASADGDLSTPTRPGGLAEFDRFGEHVDAVRSTTLDEVREIRREAAALAASGSPQEEFRLRWEELKQRIRGLAP